MNMLKRILSFALAILLVVSYIPMPGHATENEGEEPVSCELCGQVHEGDCTPAPCSLCGGEAHAEGEVCPQQPCADSECKVKGAHDAHVYCNVEGCENRSVKGHSHEPVCSCTGKTKCTEGAVAECEVCKADLSKCKGTAADPGSPVNDDPVCSCTGKTKCTEGAVAECEVCKAELSKCKGTAPVEEDEFVPCDKNEDCALAKDHEGGCQLNCTCPIEGGKHVAGCTMGFFVDCNGTADCNAAESDHEADCPKFVVKNKASLKAALASSAATITIGESFTVDEIIKIERGVTINGNGKTITGSAGKTFEIQKGVSDEVIFSNVTIVNTASEGRCVDTRGVNKLRLDGVTLNTTATATNTQPLTIGGNETGTVSVTINNSAINAGNAGYAIITFVPVNLTITGSSVASGYGVVYMQGSNSVVNIQGSTLNGNNIHSGDSNGFGTVIFQASNITFNVDGSSTVSAVNSGDQTHACFLFNTEYASGMSGINIQVANGATLNGMILNQYELSMGTVTLPTSYKEELKADHYTQDSTGKVTGNYYEANVTSGETTAPYFTLQEAVTNAPDGATITLLDNVTLSDTIFVSTTGADSKGSARNITFNGNGKKITSSAQKSFRVYDSITFKNLTIENTAANGRCIDTRVVGITVNLNAVEMKTSGSGNPQPLTIGGSGTDKITVNITASKINSGNSGYSIISFVPVNLTISSSTVASGYGVVYMQGSNSVVNIQGSTLNGNNIHSGDSNGFGTVIFQASNITFNVDGSSTVSAVNSGDQTHACFLFNSGYATITGTKLNVADGAALGGMILNQYTLSMGSVRVPVTAAYTEQLLDDGYIQNQTTGNVTGVKPTADDTTMGNMSGATVNGEPAEESEKEAIASIQGSINNNTAAKKPAENLTSNTNLKTVDKALEAMEISESDIVECIDVYVVITPDNNITKGKDGAYVVTFDVTPMVKVTIENASAKEAKIKEWDEPIKFRLPVPFDTEYVYVYHEGELYSHSKVEGTAGNRYVEVESAEFSKYAIKGAKPPVVEGANGVTYVSLAEAIAAGETNVKVTADHTSEAVTIPSGKTVTIDLNSKTVKIPNIQNNGTLTITNGTLEGNTPGENLIDSTAGSTLNANFTGIGAQHCLRVKGTTLNITGGHYSVKGAANTSTYTLRATDESTVTISDGVFVGCDGTASESGNTINIDNSTATIHRGKFSKGKQATIHLVSGKLTIDDAANVSCDNGSALLVTAGSAEVSKGTYTGTNYDGGTYVDAVHVKNGATLKITGGSFDESVEDYVPNTHKQTEKDGMYTVSERAKNVQVGTGTSAKTYESIAEAVADIAASETATTITVLENHEIAADAGVTVIPEGKNIEINLNGKTVKMPGILNKGTLYIYGGTIEGNTTASSVVENNSEDTTKAPVLTVNFTAVSLRHGIRADGGIVNVTGGSYTVNGSGESSNFGLNASSGAKVTIEARVTFSGPAGASGTTNATDGAAIYARNEGTVVTIKGGTFDKGQNDTVYVKDKAVVEIQNGTFTCTNNSAVNVGENGKATISNGTFTGGSGKALTVNEKGSLTITGGTYDEDPTAYINTATHCVGTQTQGIYTVAQHTLTDVAEIPAQCGVVGKMAHKKCNNCGKLYVTEDGALVEKQLSELAIEALTHSFTKTGAKVAYKAPTYTEDGNKEYYICDNNCGKLFIKKTDGTYEETTAAAVIIPKLVSVESGTVVVSPGGANELMGVGSDLEIDLTKSTVVGTGNTNADTVKISKDTLQNLKGKLSVISYAGKVTFNKEAVASMAAGITCDGVTIEISCGDESVLNTNQKSVLTAKNLKHKSKIITVEVLDCNGNAIGGSTTANKGYGFGTNGKLTIQVKKPISSGTKTSDYHAYWITDTKLVEESLAFTTIGGEYYAQITVTHLSDYVIGRAAKLTWSANTGDNSNIGLWIGIMGVAVVALGGVAVVALKKKKK